MARPRKSDAEDIISAGQEEVVVPEVKKDESEEIATLKAQIAEMREMLVAAVPQQEPEKDNSNMLDKTRPYLTHRNVGGFKYEQDGKSFNGKGELIK